MRGSRRARSRGSWATLLVVLGSAAGMLGAAGAAHAAPGGPVVDRRITDSRITESSGLTPSLRFPGVLWTHNDSGNAARVYAIGRTGATKAAVTLLGEPAVDWEAITSLTGPAGTAAPSGPLLAVGDIGDNTAVHANVRVAVLREPSRLRSQSVRPVRVLRLRYPDGPRDAETLLADPRTGRFYIVSKTLFGSELYAVPESLWPGRAGTAPARVSPVTTLRRVASTGAGFVTDGAFLPDGRMLLRGYGRAYVVDRPDTARDGRIAVLASARLPEQDQGESIAVVDGGRQALIGSEGAREPVYRVSVPEVPAGEGAPTLPPTPSTTAPHSSPSTTASTPPAAPAAPAASAAPARPAGASTGSNGTGRVWLVVVGAALGLAALTAAIVALVNRRS